ncbi:MAG: hypothetical protein J6X00_03875 [Clostridia bacterium]|nr:hypothetical protein [Clostridia bacterium]
MKYVINTLADYDKLPAKDKSIVAWKYMRGIVSENNKAIQEIIKNSFGDAFGVFINHFNNTFAKPAYEDGGEIKTPFHKYYYHTYRKGLKMGQPSYYYSCIKNELREVENELKYASQYSPNYTYYKKLSDKYNEILGNSKLVEENAKTIKSLVESHKPIDMSDLHTLVCFVEYQRAFADYYFRHKPEKSLRSVEDIEKYIDNFAQEVITEKHPLFDGARKFRNHAPLPQFAINGEVDKDEYLKIFDFATGADGMSALYNPYLFGLNAKGSLDWRNCKFEIVGTDYSKIELDTSNLDEEKQDKLRNKIFARVLTKLAPKSVLPEQILVHMYPINIAACEDNYYLYTQNETDKMALDYANFAQEQLNKAIKKQERKEREQDDYYDIDEEDNGLKASEYRTDGGEELFYDSEYNLVYADGRQYNGKEVTKIEDGEEIYLSNPNIDLKEDAQPEEDDIMQ